MNPVLLKPSADTYSQVIVMGRVDAAIAVAGGVAIGVASLGYWGAEHGLPLNLLAPSTPQPSGAGRGGKSESQMRMLCFGAARAINTANWHPFLPNGFPGVLTGAAIVFFTYIGFDSVSTAAEECRRPQRDRVRSDSQPKSGSTTASQVNLLISMAVPAVAAVLNAPPPPPMAAPLTTPPRWKKSAIRPI